MITMAYEMLDVTQINTQPEFACSKLTRCEICSKLTIKTPL